MSEFVMPAKRITKALGEWLLVATNDHRTALKATQEPDPEQHQGALMVGHCYVFALKAAHDAIYSEEKLPDEIAETLNTPEKRVLYFAKKLVEDIETSLTPNNKDSSQPELPGIA